MASFKIVFRRNIIYVQVIHKRKSKLRKIANCDSKHWDPKQLKVKKSDPNNKKVNLLIGSRIAEYRSLELDYELQGIQFEIEDLFHKKKQTSILDCFEEYISYLNDSNKPDAKRKSENVRDHIGRFKDIEINRLDLKYLKNLELHFLKKVSKNTTFKYFSIIKTALKFNGYSPTAFNQLRLTKTTVTQVSITREEFKLIENLDMGSDQVFIDAHLMQYYTWGTRISNILMLDSSNLTSKGLEFYEVKDNPIIKIVPIGDNIRRILDKYKDESRYLIPLLQHKRQVQSKTAMINAKLKLVAAKLGIEKNITTHVARYSFVTWLDEMNVPLKYRKEMLNHSNERMTEHYSQAKKDIGTLSEFAKKLFS